MNKALQDECVKVMEKAAHAAKGLPPEEAFEAMIRAALDHAVSAQDPDLCYLEHALGSELDAGSFLMGMQAATFAMNGGTDMIAAASHKVFGPILVEYINKARDSHVKARSEQ